MKKIFTLIIFTLISNVSYAASEKVYLKCKKIVSENKSTGIFKDKITKGAFAQIVLTEIIIAKKSSKITVYEPFPDFDDYKDSFNNKITHPIIPKQKALVSYKTPSNVNYTGYFKFNGKEEGKKLDVLSMYIFRIDGDNWSFLGEDLMKEEGGMDINYSSEGKCLITDKKYYKNILKNGPTQTDYNF